MNFIESLDLFHVCAKEIPCLTGSGAPTERTEGAPGVLYMDLDTGGLYKCRGGMNGGYRWQLQGDGGDLHGAVSEALAEARDSGIFDGKTPVKGEDYNTEADKAELVAMVLDALGGKVISGYVDSKHNIVITGLRAGAYSVKYEMEDGSIIDIGNLELDTNVYYTVVNKLTNCVNSNGTAEIAEGDGYSTTITANAGCKLKFVSVTMGGVDISANVVNSGNISITNITGNIVITAMAEESAATPSYTNLLPQAVDANGDLYVGTNGEKGYKVGYKMSGSSGNESATAGAYCTGFIPVGHHENIRIKNVVIHTGENTNNIVFYDANKVKVFAATNGSNNGFNVGVKIDGDVYTFNSGTFTDETNIAFFRFSCGGITEETIVTVNEEIV